MSSKAAPKTINQFRNAAYVLVGWIGFNRGYNQKSLNDQLWTTHRAQTRQAVASQQEAEAEAILKRQRESSPEKIPLLVPEDLKGLYTTFSKAM